LINFGKIDTIFENTPALKELNFFKGRVVMLCISINVCSSIVFLRDLLLRIRYLFFASGIHYLGFYNFHKNRDHIRSSRKFD